jgi:hypothetical protein
MRLYIHTYGRSTNQSTWHWLPMGRQLDTVLVVQEREKHLYQDYAVLVLPASITTLSPTRQWILDNHDIKEYGPTLCLLDDDLREFSVRRKDDNTLFMPGGLAETEKAFKALESALGHYAHAGVLGREGANRIADSWVYATRMMRVLAYHVPTVRAVGARFDRVPCKQDFDMNLQLLRAGYPNAVLGAMVQDQVAGSGAVGGCSAYRDDKMLTHAALALKCLHPEFVKVVEKTTKGAWGGGTRTEVIVAWKKALESSGYTITKPRGLVCESMT